MLQLIYFFSTGSDAQAASATTSNSASASLQIVTTPSTIAVSSPVSSRLSSPDTGRSTGPDAQASSSTNTSTKNILSPYHPPLPTTKFGKINRQFQPQWCQRWTWLHYDTVIDRAFCFACCQAETSRRFLLQLVLMIGKVPSKNLIAIVTLKHIVLLLKLDI